MPSEPVKAEQPDEPAEEMEPPEKSVDAGDLLEGGESEIGSDDPDYHDSHADQPDPDLENAESPRDVE